MSIVEALPTPIGQRSEVTNGTVSVECRRTRGWSARRPAEDQVDPPNRSKDRMDSRGQRIRLCRTRRVIQQRTRTHRLKPGAYSISRRFAMADLFDNPIGLMGFEFVEFASPTPDTLEPVFEKL